MNEHPPSSPVPGAGQNADPYAQNQPLDKVTYDPAIFHDKLSPADLAVISGLAGKPSGKAIGDGKFRKILKELVPNCEFHYGRDMPLHDAIDMVIKGSPEEVRVRDNRYLVMSGREGPYLSGRGFLWFDLQAGDFLGGFSFHPTNGEPTPTLAIFSREIGESYLQMSQLPPAFAADLAQWSSGERVPPVITRYFLTSRNERILLAHDEDYCSPADAIQDSLRRNCQQMNADAADLDMDAAYYLSETFNATNATAWMIGDDQRSFIIFRDNQCGAVSDYLGCRIVLAHERTRVILRLPAPGPHPVPHR
jgi:hypothetical protein